ncbi:protein TIC 20-I, chloroplastic-like [Iris pallida]|uniref:Protein TIC 20 n=1 Tax=Iris pallida TaxID=29817 RepID=A0AAX6HR74_IRIPA|nr:protein TIC 20-I, chloroplastic-like [Iris pallida]
MFYCQRSGKGAYDMNFNGCMTTSGRMNMKPNPSIATCHSSFTYLSCKPAPVASISLKNQCGPSLRRDQLSARVAGGEFTTSHLSSASATLLKGDYGSHLMATIPLLPRRHKMTTIAPRASKDVPYSFRYPAMTEKPKWWWRTLACIPYLMPLHETWMYAETAYHLHPFLEDFEWLTYPFFEFIGMLPSWFLMAYFFLFYLGVVRRKEWPHFFRFHVVMGMLLEIALQVIGTVSRWMPLSVYWGKIGMHFWTAVAFGYLFTVLECIRCALGGMYADVPFVCDAAYIQIPYD